jgi:hypothetical protein
MDHPRRAVAPQPDGGREPGGHRQHPRSPELLGSFGCQPALLSHLFTSEARTNSSPYLPVRLAPEQPLAHFVALEHIRLPHVSAEGHRSLARTVPTLPASSLISTAAIYSGRSSAGIRGTSASRGCTFASRPTKARNARAPESTQSMSGPRPTTARTTPRSLTQHAADSRRSAPRTADATVRRAPAHPRRAVLRLLSPPSRPLLHTPPRLSEPPRQHPDWENHR